MVCVTRLASLNSPFHNYYRHLLPARHKHDLSAFSPLKLPSSPGFPYLQKPLNLANCCSESSMESPPQGYRRNVGICLINPTNKIFAASRLDIPGAWQMPQGGVDEGEDPRDAAVRELKEETGVTSAQFLAEVPYWLTYDFPLEVKEKINKLWRSEWKGQAQKWFLLRFTGKEEEIDLSGNGAEAAEFAEWSWMSPQQVIDHAVDFKRPVYEEVLRVFASYFPSDSAAADVHLRAAIRVRNLLNLGVRIITNLRTLRRSSSRVVISLLKRSTCLSLSFRHS